MSLFFPSFESYLYIQGLRQYSFVNVNAWNECTAQNAGNRSKVRSDVVGEMHHQAMTNEIVSRVVMKVDSPGLWLCSPGLTLGICWLLCITQQQLKPSLSLLTFLQQCLVIPDASLYISVR